MNITVSKVSAAIPLTKPDTFLAYFVPLLAVLPSFIWIALDKSVWSWDQALYAQRSVKLFYVLIYSPQDWALRMLDIIGGRAPGLIWFGQFFVPLGYLLGSIDVGLLLFIVISQAIGLAFVYRSIRHLSGQLNLVAITGCMVMASAPLFIGLSHQYFVEPLQTLAVAWFVLIMAFAPKWSRTFILSQLLAAGSLAMLAKVSSPLYCWGPGLVALGCAFWPRSSPGKSEKLSKPVVVSLTLGVLLSLVTIIWYRENVSSVMQHVAIASEGPIAELYGRKDSFLNSLLYWLGSVQNSFFLPVILWLSGVILVIGIIYYFIKPNTNYFTLCGVVAILQITVALSVFSLNSNRDARYLLPLLPYVALLLSWAVIQINKPVLTTLVIIAFTIQLTVAYAQTFGLIQQNPRISGYLLPVNLDARNSILLDLIVAKTCPQTTPDLSYTIIGDQKPWLNINTVSYVAAKNLMPHNQFHCEYGYLGYAESDVDKIWKQILSFAPRYYVTTDPQVYPIPPDPLNQAINQLNAPILALVQTSGLFEPEPALADYPGIMIFRRKETDPRYSFGNIATLLEHQFSGQIQSTTIRVQGRLKWQLLQPITQPYTIKLSLLAPDGSTLIKQELQLTPAQVQTGEVVTQEFEIDIPATINQLPSTTLEISWVDAAGQPLSLKNGAKAIIIPDVQNEIKWPLPQP